MSRAIALIVEDREEIARMWKAGLSGLDLDIVVVATLQGALAAMGKVPPPDLILLDLRLLDSEAENTLNHVANIKQQNPNAVVIVISGLVTPQIAQLALHQGVHGVIQKIEMRRQVDLWNEIEKALDVAPVGAKEALSHMGNLLKTLAASQKALVP